MSLFSSRSAEIEVMDDLACTGEVVDQALRELEVINKWLGGNQVTITGVISLLKNIRPNGKPISIADLGCGSGDMLRKLAILAKRKNYAVALTGIDANPNIIDFARNNTADLPAIHYEALNIFSPEFEALHYDIVMGTLFFHHFTDAALIQFFSSLKKRVRIGIIINDIHRHWFAFHSIRLLTKWFSKSSMVKNDAPLSVLRAFSKKELQDILRSADIHNYSIRWRWAFRWQVIIRC